MKLEREREENENEHKEKSERWIHRSLENQAKNGKE